MYIVYSDKRFALNRLTGTNSLKGDTMKIVMDVIDLPKMDLETFLLEKEKSKKILQEKILSACEELIEFSKKVNRTRYHLSHNMVYFPEMAYMGMEWDNIPSIGKGLWNTVLNDMSLRKVLSITASIPAYVEQVKNALLNHAIG